MRVETDVGIDLEGAYTNVFAHSLYYSSSTVRLDGLLELID